MKFVEKTEQNSDFALFPIKDPKGVAKICDFAQENSS
jgi:hypothetical protein